MTTVSLEVPYALLDLVMSSHSFSKWRSEHINTDIGGTRLIQTLHIIEQDVLLR